MPTSTLTTTITLADKGQITLPEEIREHLHLKEGDRVQFVIEPGGKVYLRRPDAGSTQDLFGMLHRPDVPPRTIDEMREGMIEFLVEDNERIKRGGE